MTDIELIKKAGQLLDKGEEVAIVTITKHKGSTPRGIGSTMLVRSDGKIYGSIGGGAIEYNVIQLALEALEKGESMGTSMALSKEEIAMICGGEVEVFIKVYKTRPKLLIIGGGHVGRALYKFSSLLNFDISVLDDRKDLLTEEDFPLAERIIERDIEEALKSYKIDRNTYIVIASRSHSLDQEALEAVIKREPAYIGAIGSKKKVLTIRKNLLTKGIDEELLNKIYSPVGINISSGPPEELAISILAEILLVKNKGSLEHMRNI